MLRSSQCWTYAAAIAAVLGLPALASAHAAHSSRHHAASADRHHGAPARAALQGLVEQAASANGVPVSLVERVIMRESGYNPRAVNAGNYGLMQIRLGTARAMGYSGSAEGLLDAQTNMTYAVRYLAGAYRAAGGDENRAIALYARGYNAPRVRQASYLRRARSSSAPTPSFSGTGYGAGAAGPTLLASAAPGARVAERRRH